MESSTAVNVPEEFVYPLPATITIGVMTSLLAAAITIFNGLTVLAFALSRSLRNFGDYFILNLAIADLAIGMMSIPPYIPYLLLGYWPASKGYCLFWLVWDYVTPAASTFNMCTISIDRYFLVARPIWYRKYQSTRFLLLMILSPWVIVTLVYGPSILLWEVIAGESTIAEGTCRVPYAHELSFVLFGSFVEFIFPVVMMAVINALVFLNIRKRAKRRVPVARGAGTLAASPGFSTQVAPLSGPPSLVGPSVSLHLNPLDNTVVEQRAASPSCPESVGTAAVCTPVAPLNAPPSADRPSAAHGRDTVSNSVEEPRAASDSHTESARHGQHEEVDGATTRKQQQENHHRHHQQQQQHHHHQQQGSGSRVQAQTTESINFSRDRKAARSLFILVMVFAFCWLPYEVMALISAMCPTCINATVFEVSFWLLWANSAINPILYPLLHRRFREALFTIMKKARCGR